MKEHLFHKIWVRFESEFKHLQTTTRERVEIIRAGNLNYGDGPDFDLACIRHQGMIQFGKIELHLTCSDWYSHKHHHDPAYNSVILHVVLDSKGAKPVLRKDGTKVPTVVVGDKIPLGLLHTIRASVSLGDLSCKHVIHHISPEIIEKQLEIAASLYLEQKKQQLLYDFDKNLPPSEAWMKMVFLGWAKGLGIPSNSHQLAELAEYLWENRDSENSTALRQKIQSIPWDHSGSRPGNRPKIRYRQLQHLLDVLHPTTFRTLVNSSPGSVFDFFDTPDFGGKNRRTLLLSIVIAPALCILSDITGKTDFIKAATYQWNQVGFSAPFSIIEPFKRAGVTFLKERHSAGLVYQYKHLCKYKACDRCLIFKNAVRG